MRVEKVVLIVVGYLMVAVNGGWWSAVTEGRTWTSPYTWLFVACCFVALSALHFVLLALIANRWTVRPLLTVVVVGSATASWYMRKYSVFMDPTMIQNILHTDAGEVRDLLSWSLVGWVSLVSAPAVAFIWLVRIEVKPFWNSLLVRAGSVAGAAVLAVLVMLPVSRDITSLMRNQREARYLVTPGNLLYGLAVQSLSSAKDVNAPREPVGRDARLVRVAAAQPPRVLVLVVGETARADNFSLLGYTRETNPELATLGVTAFSHVTSCGTSTEVSVPCLFSPYGREHYDEHRIRNSETLLDVLARAGYAVKWLDNQSGCKGVCKGAGVTYEKIDPAKQAGLCDGKECWDEALVVSLRRELAGVQGNTVLVLHMMGNHGPAYFKRYPPEFRRFLPDCATAELRDCERAEVVNAYDNAILYTDHVLAGVVNALKDAGPRIDAAMLYVSDHGESLGEKGLYLHGLPYAIAPEQQTHVPMLVWLSSQTTHSGDVNLSCLRQKTGAELSHDNVFHSVLGLLNVKTSVYRSERDIFDGCRGGTYRVETRPAERGPS